VSPSVRLWFLASYREISRRTLVLQSAAESEWASPFPFPEKIALSVYECPLFKFHPPNLFSRLLNAFAICQHHTTAPNTQHSLPLQYSTQFNQLNATSFNYSNIGECGRSGNSNFAAFLTFKIFRSHTRRFVQRYLRNSLTLKVERTLSLRNYAFYPLFTFRVLTELEKMKPIVGFTN